MDNTYTVFATIAAELLKTLKRDVPFETEKDILDAHARMTEALFKNSIHFRGEATSVTDTSAQQPEVPKDAPTTPAAAKVETPKAEPTPKAVTTSEPAVLAMVQKAVDAVATKEGCEELKAKILKATKISLQDQSMLLGKLDAKLKAL
jgi:hypothetical protein